MIICLQVGIRDFIKDEIFYYTFIICSPSQNACDNLLASRKNIFYKCKRLAKIDFQTVKGLRMTPYKKKDLLKSLVVLGNEHKHFVYDHIPASFQSISCARENIENAYRSRFFEVGQVNDDRFAEP